MKLILKENISSLGFEGDVVTVKDGYGRNYLLPQGKAVAATRENLQEVEENRAALEAKRATELKKAEEKAAKLDGMEVVIEQLAGEDERLFGSVTSADICNKLAEADIELDKRQILLTEPLKTLGESKIGIKVGFSVTADIMVKIVPAKA